MAFLFELSFFQEKILDIDNIIVLAGSEKISTTKITKKLNLNELIAKFSFIKIETIKIINMKASLLFADKSYLSSNKPIKKITINDKNKEKISLVVFKKFKSSFANI